MKFRGSFSGGYLYFVFSLSRRPYDKNNCREKNKIYIIIYSILNVRIMTIILVDLLTSDDLSFTIIIN